MNALDTRRALEAYAQYRQIVSAAQYCMVFCGESGFEANAILETAATNICVKTGSSFCVDNESLHSNMKRWQYMRELVDWKPLPMNKRVLKTLETEAA